MEDQTAYERAKKRVQSKVGFYTHLVIYLVVMALLVIINLSASPGYTWFIWPLMGWGLAVILHGLRVFLGSSGAAITEEMIEREMEKERRE